MATSDSRPPEQCPLDLPPGDAALARLSRRGSAIRHLPRSAYENLLVVTVDAPGTVQAAVEEAGGDPANVGIVPVSAAPLRYDGPCWTAEHVSPSDLTGISIEFSRGEQYLADGSGWVVADGLGTLLMYAEEEDLYRLFSHLVGRARDCRLRHVTGVAESVVSQETLARFSSLHNRTVSLE